ncbi:MULTISPECIES: hypothetical protein [unclassified Kitasatospora]|uniref:hypothetical protein n=1 Tax=unclassified Kitasatospora TaxID=2633591 RepID=UPI0024750732|nr:hypothetical protein [Kitasatospora sp. GAS204B]
MAPVPGVLSPGSGALAATEARAVRVPRRWTTEEALTADPPCVALPSAAEARPVRPIRR